jgi:hypothetical protein
MAVVPATTKRDLRVGTRIDGNRHLLVDPDPMVFASGETMGVPGEEDGAGDDGCPLIWAEEQADSNWLHFRLRASRPGTTKKVRRTGSTSTKPSETVQVRQNWIQHDILDSQECLSGFPR